MIVLSRIAGIMVFAPVLSSRPIPVQFKVAFSLVTSIALLPTAARMQIPADLDFLGALACGLSQALLGMTLGLAAAFVFAAMQLAGQLISFNLGFAIINVIDPQSEVEVSVFAILQNYLGMMLFLLLNGHHWFFMAVSESFNYLPAKGIQLNGPLVHEVIRLSAQMLLTGIQIAAPVLAVTIICDVVLGIIGRAAPQIQILIVGMPLKTLVGFSCLSFSFYFLPQLLGKSFSQLFRELFAIVHALA